MRGEVQIKGLSRKTLVIHSLTEKEMTNKVQIVTREGVICSIYGSYAGAGASFWVLGDFLLTLGAVNQSLFPDVIGMNGIGGF